MLGGFAEPRHVLGRIFARGEHRPQHGDQQRRAADPEGVANGVGDASAGRDIGNSPPVEHRRDQRPQHGARADEGGLHRIAARVLVLAQHVADEGAERLHGDVEAGVERPQQDR